MTVSRIGIASVGIALLFAGWTASASARAIKENGVQVVSNDLLPNPEFTYSSPGGEAAWHPPGKAVNERGLRITAFDGVSPTQLPTGEWTFDTNFLLSYDMSLEVDGVVYPVAGNGAARMAGTAPAGQEPRVFDIELLSLDISGGIPGGGFMLRESPTLASTGQLLFGRLPDDRYLIDNFFDVFTEMSLDGGATWHAAVAQVPEPSTIGLALLCACSLTALRRKRRRVAPTFGRTGLCHLSTPPRPNVGALALEAQ